MRRLFGCKNVQTPNAMPDRCLSIVRGGRFRPGVLPMAGAMLRVLLPLLALAVLVVPARAGESGREPWQTIIEEHHATPERLIAVDKSRQQLSLFERRSPLKLTRLFTCTTGQSVGDKEREGDLKTPEGVYFVVQRIGSGLEYLKYGTEAYTLNYPNPVDRLRKKTGYGIWIHGRGEPLAPLQTQGCVSMNNEDLAAIGGVLAPGTPVALTESFSQNQGKNSREAATASLLEKKSQAWAKAWGQRSASLFDFYDKQAYSIAQGEAFSRFQTQKERLFRQLPWINNSIRDIRVLEGPGYWVTWFYQDYKAPNLSTSGIRRLYWVPDGKGDFKIVGMEWAPGMASGTLLASAEPALPPIEAQPRTEEQVLPPPAKTGGAEIPATEPDAGAGLHVADASGKAQAASPAVPPVQAASSAPAADPSGAAKAAAEPPASEKRHFADHVEDPRQGKMAEPPQAARQMAEKRAKETRAASSAPESSRPPALDLPPALPSQGLAAGQSSSSPVAAPVAVSGLPEQKGGNKEGAPDMLASAPSPSSPPESGPAVPKRGDPGPAGNDKDKPAESRLREGPDAAPPARDGGPRMPAAPERGAGPASGDEAGKVAAAEAFDRTAKPLAEDVASLVSGRVEAWREAWESGNLDGYMAFYAPTARQGSRSSAESIRKHKIGLWRKAAPASLTLEDMRIEVGQSSVTVAMRQEYADSSGGGDRGLKTLTFENVGGLWLITQETWSPLPDEAGN